MENLEVANYMLITFIIGLIGGHLLTVGIKSRKNRKSNDITEKK